MLFPDIVPGSLITTPHSNRAFSVWLYTTPLLGHEDDEFAQSEPFYDGIVISRTTDAESIATSGALRLPILVLCSRTMRVGWVSIYDVRAA